MTIQEEINYIQASMEGAYAFLDMYSEELTISQLVNEFEEINVLKRELGNLRTRELMNLIKGE